MYLKASFQHEEVLRACLKTTLKCGSGTSLGISEPVQYQLYIISTGMAGFPGCSWACRNPREWVRSPPKNHGLGHPSMSAGSIQHPLHLVQRGR